MKRIFWIFSLAMLLFSTFTPSFTYAEVDDEYILNTFSSLLNWIWTERELNNLTENSDWSKTIISWDIEITIASSNQSTLSDWKYFWWNDTETSLSQTSDTRWEQFNDNRWWWNDILNNWYNWWLNQKRKWPCDDWRHVPSRWEWNDLAVAWCTQNENCNVETDISYNDDWTVKNLYNAEKTLWKLFKEDFSLQDWVYWTSTPYPGDNNKAFVESIWNAALVNSDSWRASRNYVRCFKDIIKNKTITYHPNWWSFSGMNVDVVKTYEYQTNENWIIPIYNIQIPNRISINTNQQSWWMFAWWYTQSWQNNEWWEEFDPETSTETVAYAKWLPFNDLTISLWDLTFTIMDRNLWAKKFYESPISPQWNYDEETLWLYYQRWNNYWINGYWNNSDYINSKFDSNRKDVNDFWPWNYFYHNKYIQENNISSWHTETNRNLWWENWELDKDRQWPCPKWYHIPKISEFENLIKEYNKRKVSDEWVEFCSNYNFTANNFCFAVKLHIPIAWYIANKKIYNKWSYLWLRSTTTQENDYSNANSRYFFIRDSDNSIAAKNTMTNKIQAYPLRCLKDEIKRIEYETNWWYFEWTYLKTTSWIWSSSSNLPKPKKNEWPNKFAWRYTGIDFNDWNLVTTNKIKSDLDTITLYAKWECEDWTSMNEDGTQCIENVWKIDSNNWSNNLINTIKYVPENPFINMWYNFVWWNTQKDWLWIKYYSWNYINVSWLLLYAQREKTPRYTLNLNWGKINNESVKYIKSVVKKSEKQTIRIYDWEQWLFSRKYTYTPIPGAKRLKVKLESVMYQNYFSIKIYTWENEENTVITTSPDTIYPIYFDLPWDKIVFEVVKQWPPTDINFSVLWEIWYYTDEDILIPTRRWYEFLWWYETWATDVFVYDKTQIEVDKTLYAHWKALEEKAQETITENVVYTNNTTVTVWDEITEEVLSWSTTTIELKSKEVESEEVKTEEDKTKVQEAEIKVTSDKTVEYEWWLEVYLEKKVNEQTEMITWTAKFSAPIAVKIPVTSDSEYVKVQVKHYWEEFWYTWLTLNRENECQNWVAINDKYNWENIKVKESNWEKYVLIYTCSASTFVAYSENKKPVVPTPAAWGWRTIKQESKATEQEHNSADTEKTTEQENNKSTTQTKNNSKVNEQVKNFSNKSLTRWEVAVMTNILLEVYPQLVEGKTELDDVTNACWNYADEQNFTKDEKKAITRLCKLSIMWIHRDTKEPLDEFLAKQIATNWEFVTVMDRVVANYNEKDLKVVKEALKKLEWDEGNVVFWTVYDVFMSIKNIFN